MPHRLFGEWPADERRDVFLDEQARLLYASLPASLAINTLLALILISVQYAVIPYSQLAWWASILVAILFGRLALLLAWRRAGSLPEHCGCWLRRFRIGILALGAAWGLGALLMFPHGNIDHQVYLSFVLAGLAAGAVASLAVDRVSMFGFLALMLLPLVMHFWQEGGRLALAMGVMVMLFLVFMMLNTSRVRRNLYENINLRLEAETQERHLRESEVRLKEAQHTAKIGNWELDLTTNRLYWSDEIFRIFEVDPSVFGASYDAFLNAIHPGDREAVSRAYTNSLQTREPYEITHRLLMADGRIKWVTERCESFFDVDGKSLRSVGTVQDVTVQKQAEMARDEQQRNQEALLNAIQESTFLMERNGTLQVINDVAARRLNSTPQALEGRNAFDLLPPELARVRREKFERIAAIGLPDTLEDEREGRRFLSSIYPVRDELGEVSRFAIYAADVTQQRRMQAIEELFSAINQRVLSGLPLIDVLHFICEEVARLFDLNLIWLGRKEADGAVSIFTHAGPAEAYVASLDGRGIRWDDTPQGRGATGMAIRSGQVQFIRPADPGFKVWRDLAEEYGFQSMMAIPLLIRGEVYGAFTLYSSRPDAFSTTTDLLVGVATRISVALEAAMDQQQIRLLSSALETAGNGVMITNPRGIIQWVNPAFARLSGYSKEELVGQTPRVLKSGQNSQEYYRILWETIARGETWSSETIERAKDGSIYTVSQTITPMLDDDGKITHFIAIHEDITAQKKTQERIAYLAHYDALTGLPNRALFYDRLRQALSLTRRNRSGLTLMFLDLDGFKRVNDTMGHQAGDRLLIAVAERLGLCVRESDTIARLGGDEFTVLLNDAHEQQDISRIAEKIIETIAQPFDLEGLPAKIGVSIGIARYSDDADDEDALVNKADGAMYEAKAAGKNTFRFAPPMAEGE